MGTRAIPGRADGESPELGDRLRVAVARLYRRLRSERPQGSLGDAAFSVLTRLHVTGPRSLTALSEDEGVSLATMSETVNRLTSAGYAVRTRDDVDRRRVLFSATPEGDRLTAAARAQRHAWFNARLEVLGADDRAVLDRAALLLARIADEPSPDETGA